MSDADAARHPDGPLDLRASPHGTGPDVPPDGARPDPARHERLRSDAALPSAVRLDDEGIRDEGIRDEGPGDDAPDRPDRGRLDADLAAQIAAGLASSTELRHGVARSGRGSTVEPVRLIGTPSYDVWITDWSPGQRSRLVDLTAPGGTIALAVADGALLELAADGRLDRGRRLAKGAVLAVDDGSGAELVNGGSTDATTVHVCSPPRQLSVGHQRA